MSKLPFSTLKKIKILIYIYIYIFFLKLVAKGIDLMKQLIFFFITIFFTPIRSDKVMSGGK